MSVPFNKRKVFQSLLDPYKPLSDKECLNQKTGIYCRRLAGTDRPRDKHYIYEVVLVEVDTKALGIALDEKSSCHLLVENVGERGTIQSYILLDRAKFDPENILQLTERLLCAAHELLFPVQYPQIVRNTGGRVTKEDITHAVIIPDPDEELDLVCSFVSVARFLDTIQRELGVTLHTPDKLHKFHASSVGQTRFESYWKDICCIAVEIAFARTHEFIELGFAEPRKTLAPIHEQCRSMAKGQECRASNAPKECVACPHFGNIVRQLQRKTGQDYAIDHELVAYLHHQI